jgi:hypothetical protein
VGLVGRGWEGRFGRGGLRRGHVREEGGAAAADAAPPRCAVEGGRVERGGRRGASMSSALKWNCGVRGSTGSARLRLRPPPPRLLAPLPALGDRAMAKRPTRAGTLMRKRERELWEGAREEESSCGVVLGFLVACVTEVRVVMGEISTTPADIGRSGEVSSGGASRSDGFFFVSGSGGGSSRRRIHGRYHHRKKSTIMIRTKNTKGGVMADASMALRELKA